MSTPELNVGDDHPLHLELQSLRGAVARYQHEAHATSVKLQRHSLDTSHALERTHALETENAKLREELETLRANPDSTPHPGALQVPELTLALRKLSDKLTATEDTLFARTAELLHTREALSQAHHDSSAARDLVIEARAHEEAAKERERQMALRAKAAEEERKMTDFVVQEYADLVRTLQGQGRHSRNPSASSQNGAADEAPTPPTPAESLAEGKTGLQRLLSEFNGESEKLTSDLHRLQGEVDLLAATLEVERKSSDELRSQLADALVQLDKYKADDTTAAKMVSRYMSVPLTVISRYSIKRPSPL
ncbi:hypothetical protein QCA50_003436 [Cerrena zonata]|uniref:Uncharacterized protein n=1 Tax=Cerrena zonata TaxID=2478898 RepID=A0AAW0GKI7_9APHY